MHFLKKEHLNLINKDRNDQYGTFIGFRENL